MRLALTVLASSIMLAACGGSDDTPRTGPNTPRSAITADNYVVVAQAAYTDDLDLDDVEEITKFLALALSEASSPVAGVPSVDAPLECESGTMTRKVNDANGNGDLDPGDSVTIDTNQCKLQDWITLTGSATVIFKKLHPDQDDIEYVLDVDVTYKGLSITADGEEGPEEASVNGTLSFLEQSSSVQGEPAWRTQISTSALEYTFTKAGERQSVGLYDYEIVRNWYQYRWSRTVDGILVSSEFDNKSIQIATPVPFVESEDDYYPSTGSMTVTGANGSKMRITAVDNTTVRLELDADGNGEYETTVDKPWADFD